MSRSYSLDWPETFFDHDVSNSGRHSSHLNSKTAVLGVQDPVETSENRRSCSATRHAVTTNLRNPKMCGHLVRGGEALEGKMLLKVSLVDILMKTHPVHHEWHVQLELR